MAYTINHSKQLDRNAVAQHMAEFNIINQQQWARSQHFEFYRTFEQPYFSIGFNLDAKGLFEKVKQADEQFFHAYMYLILRTVNLSEPFRLRIVENQVRDYQQINGSCAMLADDNTFRYVDFDFNDNYQAFSAGIVKAKTTAINRPFIYDQFEASQQHKNTVYMTVIPWINFTSFSHAWQSKDDSGVPRIVVGKMDAHHQLPISIDVHHALVDGIHVGVFSQALQQAFDEFSFN